MIRKFLNIFLIILFALLISNCSSRYESPSINTNDEMISYSPKDKNGINAKIIFYNGTDEATGLPLTAKSFKLGKEAKVYAAVKLENYMFHHNEELMFHIDWIDPEGNSFFKKRVDMQQNDSSAEIKSAISIQPEKRDTGNYKFRVYLFRELIAEKSFKLVSYNVDSAAIFSRNKFPEISAKILLGQKYDKKKEIPVDTGQVFMIKEKTKVYANISFLNKNLYDACKIKGDICWFNSNDSLFYNKKINFSSSDKSTEIRSAISINSKTRQPGKYKLKVYLYGNLIGEKTFELIPEKKEEIKISIVKGINVNLIFAGRINKKTNKCLDVSDKFVLKDKAKVYAVVTVSGGKEKRDKSSKVKIEWFGPDHKSFYKKIFDYNAADDSSLILSSISISPDKRKPGEYICKVFYNSSLLSEKKFNLISD